MLGLTVTDANGDWKKYLSVAATYFVVFIINLLYDVMTAGGLAACTWLSVGNSALKALLITFIMFAANYGIEWRQTVE